MIVNLVLAFNAYAQDATLFERTLVEYADGTSEIRTAGSLLVQRPRGVEVVDPSRLRLESGVLLEQTFSARQESEDGPVTYSYRVNRRPGSVPVTVSQLLEAYNEGAVLRGEEPISESQLIAMRASWEGVDPLGIPALISTDLSGALELGPARVGVLLRDEVPLQLPVVSSDLVEVAPDLALEARANLLLGLEAHRTSIEQAQETILDELHQRFGPADVESDRIVNAFRATLSQDGVDWLASRTDVKALSLVRPPPSSL